MQDHAKNGGGSTASKCRRPEQPTGNALQDTSGSDTTEGVPNEERRQDIENSDEDTSDDDGVQL
jgi:hypothetical protein